MKVKQKISKDHQKILDDYEKIHKKIVESILHHRIYSQNEKVPKQRNPKVYSSVIPPTMNIAHHEILDRNLVKESSPANLKQLAEKHAIPNILQQIVQKSSKLTQKIKKSKKLETTKQKRRVRDNVLGATDTRNLILQYLDNKELTGEMVLVLLITLYTLLFLFYFLKCMFIDIDILFYIFHQVQQPIRTPTSRDKYFNLEQEKSITRKNFEHLFTIMDEERGKPFLKFTNEILHMMDLVKRILKPLFSGPNSMIALSQKIKIEPYWRSRENNELDYKESLFRKKKKRAQTGQYPFITFARGSKQEPSNRSNPSSSTQEKKVMKYPNSKYNKFYGKLAKTKKSDALQQEIPRRIKNYLDKLIHRILKQMESILEIIKDLQNLLHLIGKSNPILQEIVNPSQPQMDDTRLETDMYMLEEGVGYIVESLLNFSNYGSWDEIADYCQKINE